jgi:anti-anti-sigma factor
VTVSPERVVTEPGSPAGLCRCEVELIGSAVGQIAVLRVIGELDSYDTAMVGAALGNCLGQRPKHLVVDLTHLRFCSGWGMAVLVETSWDAAAMGIGYSLAGCPAALARFMLMEWKDQVPHRYRNTADAIAEATVDLLLPTPRRPRSRPA